MSLNISKVHRDAIVEYIYNKLDEEQLYYPFIDLELEKRIRYLCYDVYKAGYRDGQETKELEDEKKLERNKPVVSKEQLMKFMKLNPYIPELVKDKNEEYDELEKYVTVNIEIDLDENRIREEIDKIIDDHIDECYKTLKSLGSTYD